MLKCGLLGKKLGHSYSPRIHGMLGDYAYGLYEKTEEDLEDFLKNGDWDGLNVTIPYKKTVLPYLTELSDGAAGIGSVNTLVRRKDGSIFGDNTDAFGFQYLLEKNHMDPEGEKVLILGNGGACAAVRYVLDQWGAKPVVISRSGADNYRNLEKHADAKLIVNTTPVGMYPENGEKPLDLAGFPGLKGVLDIIYNPARTALLLQAEELGIPFDCGLSMLTAQALRSSELFTGAVLPKARIAEVTEVLSREMQNIILIGMPGCGKTTIARLLQEKTGRELVDTDEEFRNMFDCTPEACILKDGEAEFRNKESLVLKNVCRRSGLLVSTGGGCVTVPSNYPLLHQNGRIFWIQRELSRLSSEGRPLSQMEGAERLYAKRKTYYESFADEAVDNNGSAEACAQQILRFC